MRSVSCKRGNEAVQRARTTGAEHTISIRKTDESTLSYSRSHASKRY